MVDSRRQPVGFRLPLEGLLPSKQKTSIKGEVMWWSYRVPTSPTPVEV